MIDAMLALPDHVVLTLIVLVLVNVGLYVVAWTNDQGPRRLRLWWRARHVHNLRREYSYTLQQLWAVTKVEIKK